MTDRNTHPEPKWLTPGEASAALGITPTHLARLADKGVIRAMRPTGGHRRYLAADVSALIAQEPWEPAS